MATISLEPTDNTQRPKRADARANRAVLVATAKRLFDEHGVSQVNMSQIAREAGVGKGTLYRAFVNKGALCFALMDEDLRLFQDGIMQAFAAMHHGPALERLTFFLDRAIYFFDKHAPLMHEAQAHRTPMADWPEMNQTMLHRWFHLTVALLLRQAQAEGSISAESDPAYLADFVLAPLNPMLFHHQRNVLGLSLDKISQNHIKFVLHGIRA